VYIQKGKNNQMIEVLQYEFMQNAIMAAVLSSLICGLIGTVIVVKRLVILAGGIAHAAYGGIGIAAFLGIPLRAGALVFSAFLSLVMGRITLINRARADTVIGVIWAVGMAVGVICVDLTPGYGVDLMSYLFGSILSVSRMDLYMMGAIAALGGILFFRYYRIILVYIYDEDFARTRGVRVDLIHHLLVLFLSISVVLVIRVVGLILIIALLTIPPHIAESHSKSLAGMVLLSSLLSLLFSLSGLWLSYIFDLTSGASIIMVAGAGYLISMLIKSLSQGR
jgi:zinc transport system permease protein